MPNESVKWKTDKTFDNINGDTIANGAGENGDVNLHEIGAEFVLWQLSVTSSAGASGSVNFNFLNSVNGGTVKDTITRTESVDISFSGAETKTYSLKVGDSPFIRCRIFNATGEDITATLRYAYPHKLIQ